MIAAGEHPVPIDLEMILQATAAEHKTEEIEAQAFQAAMEIVDNSVMHGRPAARLCAVA